MKIKSLFAQNNVIASGFTISLWLAMQAHGHDATFRWVLGVFFLLAGAVLWQCFVAYKKEVQLPLYGSLISYGLFLAWCVLSILWSIVPADSVLMLMTLSLSLLAMCLGYSGNKSQDKWLRICLSLLACIVSGYMLYQSFSFTLVRPNAWFINPNSTAAFLSLILIPLCGRYIQQETSTGAMLIFGICFAISLTQGRGVALGILVAMAVLGYAAWQAKKSKSLMRVLLYLLLAYLVGYGVQIGVLGQGSALSRLSETSGVDSARLLLWKEGWAMYLQRPFFGWGIGQFHWLHAIYKDPLLNNPGMFVHNDFFQFLIELGPVGLILSLWFVWRLLSAGWRLFVVQKQNNKIDLYAVSLLAACIGLLVHTQLTFNLYQAPMLMLMGWYIGTLSRLNVAAGIEKTINFLLERNISYSAYMSFFSMISLAIVIWLGSLFFAFRALDLSFTQPNPVYAFTQLKNASKFNSLIDEFHARQAVLILGLLKLDDKKLNVQETQNFINYGLAQIDIALAKHPYRSISYRTKAELLLRQQGKQSDAKEALYQALKVNPYDLESRVLLFELLQETNDKQEAVAVLQGGFGRMYYKTSYQVAINFLMTSYHGLEQQQSAVKRQIDKIRQLMMKKAIYVKPFILEDLDKINTVP